MQILYVGTDDRLDWTRRKILSVAGYSVLDVREAAQAGELARTARLAILSNLVSRQKRDAIALFLARQYPDLLQLAFDTWDTTLKHAELIPPQVKPDELLKLVGTALMRQHQHPEVSSKYFLYVDRRRQYTNVSDGVCELLGFRREEIIGRTIDWLTYDDVTVPALFDEFLKASQMTGTYALRSKKGLPVVVEFTATVLADGCLCSELSPVELSQIPPR